MDIKEIKKEVRSILRKNGYKKFSYNEFWEHANSYSLVDGNIVCIVGKIYYAFGIDKLMGCSAHIRNFDSDCATSATMLLPTFEKHISGKISEKEIIEEWFSE